MLRFWQHKVSKTATQLFINVKGPRWLKPN